MNPIPSAESDTWNNAEGSSGGLPVLLRYRPQLEAFLGDPRYSRRLVIAWHYPITNSSGLPSDDQNDEMRLFEDLIQSHLDPDGTAILAYARTHSGTRRLNYYISDAQTLSQRINKALANQPKFPIELEVEDDPEWTGLRTILERCK